MSGALHLQPGSLFARHFRIVRVLGHGGMGTVYEARHETTGAARALKLMLPQFAEDPRFLRKFSQEARLSACIDSDHVVQVLDAGVDDVSGVPFLVMELLKGESLNVYVERKGMLSVAELQAVFTQLCHAIDAAHRAGVVHRDLKPENIFLSRARREGVPFVVKVLDFGIAKVLAESSPTSTVRLGSPLWVAPEQTEAERVVTPASDLWALGLLAFYCLTGRCYWVQANRPEFSIPAQMRELLFDPLASASDRARALGVQAPLPEGFDWWFARCVDRDPGQRFPSASEARAELLAILQPGELIELEPQLDPSVEPPLHKSVPPPPPSLAGAPAHTASLSPPRRRGWLAPVAAAVVGCAALAALLPRFVGREAPLPGDAALAQNKPPPAGEPQPASGPAAAAQPGEPRPATQAEAPRPGPGPTAAQAPAPPAAAVHGGEGQKSASPRPPSEPAEPRRSTEPSTNAALRGSPPVHDSAAKAEETKGFLTLVCAPFCESVQVRGRSLGPSPIVREALAPGSYTATLQRRGQPPRTVSFSVQPGQVTSVRIKLDEGPKADCSPPYQIDQQGRRRLKPECREL